MRISITSLNCYPVGGSVAGKTRSMRATTSPTLGFPAAFAFQATAWDANHVAKGSTPRPLELPGGSTG